MPVHHSVTDMFWSMYGHVPEVQHQYHIYPLMVLTVFLKPFRQNLNDHILIHKCPGGTLQLSILHLDFL